MSFAALSCCDTPDTTCNTGVGNFVNVAVLLVLMVIFDTYHPIHGVSPPSYHPKRLEGARSLCVFQKLTAPMPDLTVDLTPRDGRCGA